MRCLLYYSMDREDGDFSRLADEIRAFVDGLTKVDEPRRSFDLPDEHQPKLKAMGRVVGNQFTEQDFVDFLSLAKLCVAVMEGRVADLVAEKARLAQRPDFDAMSAKAYDLMISGLTATNGLIARRIGELRLVFDEAQQILEEELSAARIAAAH